MVPRVFTNTFIVLKELFCFPFEHRERNQRRECLLQAHLIRQILIGTELAIEFKNLSVYA